MTWVALLRGINVGGRHRLPMEALRKIFEDAGCARVRSYIQSGNVLFDGSAARARNVPAVVAAAVEAQFGFSTPVVLRSGKELERIAEANPFIERGEDENSLHVAYLAERPAAARVATLDRFISPPDEFIVAGTEIYLCYPRGMAKSKLTASYLDSRLKTVSTVRNWRTTCALLQLARS